MIARIVPVAALVGVALLTAGCGQGDAPTAKESTPAADPSAASTGATPPTTSSAETAVLAWLRDPELGMELSDAMARCEAREIVASDLPDDFLARLAEDGFTPTQDETDQLLSAVGEAEQTCVAELPDDPAAP